MPTTAISYRRGNNQQTSGWVDSVEAEITVDTTNKTLWVHSGDGTVGTELARSDLANVSSTSVTNNLDINILTSGTYKLLTYNLNNFRGQDWSSYYVTTSDNNPTLGAEVARYLDLPTNTTLTTSYALTTLSNIDTVNLGTSTGHSGKNLTYTDFSNFRNQDWTSYYDAVTDTNITLGTEVARYLGIPTSLSGYVTQTDLQNAVSGLASTTYVDTSINTVSGQFSSYQALSYRTTDITTYNDNSHYPTNQAVYNYVTTYVPTLMSGYEQTINKVNAIPGNIDTTHYPSTKAVNDFFTSEVDNIIESILEDFDFANANLNNITDWSMATASSSTINYYYNVNITNPGSGYSENDVITTNITYIDPDTQTTKYFKINVKDVNSSGGITDAEIDPGIMNVSLSGRTYTDSNHGGAFSFVDNTYGIGGNLVDRSSNQTIGGTKTFSSTISGSINGNAATVTNGVYTTGNQNIDGQKTFYQPVIIQHSGRDSENTSRSFFQAVNPEIDLTQVIATNTQNYTGLGCFDNNMSEIAYCRGNSVRNSTDTANVNRLELYAVDPDQTHTHQLGNRINTSIYLSTDGTNREASLNFTPTTSSNSKQIATTAWVRNLFSDGFGMPDYSQMVTLTSADNPYTPTKNGYLVVKRASTYPTISVTNNTYSLNIAHIYCGDSDQGQQTVMVPVNKNEEYSFSSNATSVTFIPAKGE